MAMKDANKNVRASGCLDRAIKKQQKIRSLELENEIDQIIHFFKDIRLTMK